MQFYAWGLSWRLCLIPFYVFLNEQTSRDPTPGVQVDVYLLSFFLVFLKGCSETLLTCHSSDATVYCVKWMAINVHMFYYSVCIYRSTAYFCWNVESNCTFSWTSSNLPLRCWLIMIICWIRLKWAVMAKSVYWLTTEWMTRMRFLVETQQSPSLLSNEY
jgi:hypothetical protein